MSVTTEECPSCHRGIRLNTEKHLNRNYRFCPWCRTRIPVKIPAFAPRPDLEARKALESLARIAFKFITRGRLSPSEWEIANRKENEKAMTKLVEDLKGKPDKKEEPKGERLP